MPVKSDKPFDYSSQLWRGIDDKFPKKIHNATSTSDGLMSAEDKAKLDAVDIDNYDRVYDVATWENDGLMSKEDKKKMDGIEENANNYIHPNTPEIRHVTDEQIAYWNAKASTAVATQTENGLMSAEDKKKLDNIEEYANNYIHPDTPEIRHVTDKEKEYWNNKASTEVSNPDKDGLMSAEDKKKLDSIEWNANNYIHPNNEGIRHVSDAEKEYWNSKADKTLVTNSEDGLMAAVDKIKLDGIEAGANKYVHPEGPNWRHVTDAQIKFWNSKSSAEIATPSNDGLMSKEDKIILDKLASIDPTLEDKHYVSSEQMNYWNNKADKTVVTQNKDGLMSKEDKIKLDGIDEGANNYVHPDNENIRHVTDAEKEYWNSKASIELADPSKPGLMSAADKKKLDGIEEGANNYVHPDTVDIRHVSDKEKETWNNKADTTLVSEDNNGLMSSSDKVKLDAIEDQANNYVHPDSHPASMIIEDKYHRFVTDSEKEKWNTIGDIELVTPDNNGLMSKEDKKKLDELIVPETHELSLIYSEWTDMEPYTQVLNVPGIEPGINAYIGINSEATVEQMTCAAEAKLKVGKVEKDKITILATGRKPSMNLPVIIMAGSSILIFEVKQFNGREEYAYEAPLYGFHHQNEIVYSFKPVQTGCIGWVCTETGEPGKWQPFGTFELAKP